MIILPSWEEVKAAIRDTPAIIKPITREDRPNEFPSKSGKQVIYEPKSITKIIIPITNSLTTWRFLNFFQTIFRCSLICTSFSGSGVFRLNNTKNPMGTAITGKIKG
ncbi:hypothetical protein ES708_33124 [subsurface metagenome]